MGKILITGAAGFVGSHLIEHLIADGVKYTDIRLLVAPWDKLVYLPGLPFEVIVADIRNISELKFALLNVDIVYHLASKTGHDGGSYEYYKDTIVSGTKNLINLSIKNKVKKFIYFSSTGVYGLPATRGNMTNIDESSTPQPSEGYGKAKYMAEREVIKASKKGLKYIIIRPVTIFGCRDKGGMTQLINSIRSRYFFYIGNGKNNVSYIYVKDLIKITRLLERGNRYNFDLIIAPYSPISTKEIVATISNILKISTPKIHVPFMFMLAISYLYKTFFLIIKMEPMIFPNRVKVIVSDFYFNVYKLKEILPRYKFYSFTDAIEETILSCS